MNRRNFFRWIVHGGGALVAGIVAIPSVLFALSPLIARRPDQDWRSVGNVDDFSTGDMTAATVDRAGNDWSKSLNQKLVYVWRVSDDRFVVFSRNCTDLSCPVLWDPGSECFFCPCHGGIFSKNGDQMAGPPRRPLFRYATRIRRGVLEIDVRSLPPIT